MDTSIFDSARMKQEPMAILFADVTGCVGIYKQLGNKQGLRLVGRTVRRMTRATEALGGTVVKTIGDEVMSRFKDADQAMQSAFEIMEQVDAMPVEEGIKVQVKIGLEADKAIQTPDGDVHGEAVNMAARMVGQARAGQILTTEDTVKKLTPPLRMMAHCIGPVSVKGLDQKVTIYDVNWRRGEVTGFIPKPASSAVQAALVLTFRDTRLVLEADSRGASIGKAPENTLPVDGDFTSRHHADISWRSRRFVLKDHSRNGTFYKGPSGVEMHIHQGEADLALEGSLCFGMSHDETPEDQYVHLSSG